MNTDERRELAVRYALTLLGLPYRWGGDDPIEGFDCSGGVIEVLTGVGLLPHNYDTTAVGLFRRYEGAPVDVAGPGVLSFYGSHPNLISHVGFCINDEIMFEFGGGRSSTTDRQRAADQNAFGRLRPILFRADFQGLRDPFAG